MRSYVRQVLQNGEAKAAMMFLVRLSGVSPFSNPNFRASECISL